MTNYKVTAAYFRCGGIVNNQIKKGLLLSLRVKIFFQCWIFGKVTSKNVIARLANTLLKDEESAEDKVHETTTKYKNMD